MAFSENSREAALLLKRLTENRIEELRSEAAALTGKEHRKDRARIGRDIAALRSEPRYVDTCRVLQGHAPVHGFYEGIEPVEPAPDFDTEKAARVTAEVEAELAALEPEARVPPASALPTSGLPEDPAAVLSEWRARMAKLEAKLAAGLHAASPDDIDELERVASDVVDYKTRLHSSGGYTNKDLREDPDLQRIEERLDVLAAAMLPAEQLEPEPGSAPACAKEPPVAIEDLARRERELAARLVARLEETAGLSPSEVRELKKLVSEVSDLKANLRADGLTEHEQDRDEEVFKRLIRLSEIRQKEHHDKKHDRRLGPERDAARSDLAALRTELSMHRRRLREERSGSHKVQRYDPELCQLEARLSVLMKLGGS